LYFGGIHRAAQRRGEALHLLLERLAVVRLRLGADIAARRQHVAVLADLDHAGERRPEMHAPRK
jgi:hypothetical protein